MSDLVLHSFTRHQIYLEGYKDSVENELAPTLRGMRAEVAAILDRAGVDNLNELSRTQFNRVLRELRDTQRNAYSRYRARLIKELQAFTEAENRMTVNLLTHLTGTSITEAFTSPVGLAVYGLAAFRLSRRNRANRRRLWAYVSRTPDAATGVTPLQAIDQYLAYVTREVSKVVTRGYADGLKTTQILAGIFGTPSRNFKDGILRKVTHQGGTAIRTVIQAISARIQAGVSSIFYRSYEWVAILDEGTTDICRGRNGNIYQYGIGPLPPAHYRCRSRAVPTREDSAYVHIPDNFHGWLLLQPTAVQNDIVGSRLGRQLRKGEISPADLGEFNTRKALTLDEYLRKYLLIIT